MSDSEAWVDGIKELIQYAKSEGDSLDYILALIYLLRPDVMPHKEAEEMIRMLWELETV